MNKSFILFCILTIASFYSKAQKTENNLVAALDSFSLLRPQEKAYLQTDRDVYMTGESIFFKAYVLLDEKPTVLSKIVYAELVNSDGKIIEKKMLKLINGTANASFDVKNTLIQKEYYVRCYTLWMQNFPDFIFEKKINIVSAKSVSSTEKFPIPVVTCLFFPEGGYLLNGVKNKVAFKTSLLGNEKNSLSGVLLDNQNNKLDSIKNLHDGMGFFEFTPELGKSYKVILNDKLAKPATFILPVAKNEGIIISTDNTNANKVFVRVERNENNKANYNKLIVVAQLNNNIVYLGKLNIDEGLDAVAIPKKDLPSGIMQITIFTANNKPLVERLVFVSNYSNNNDALVNVTLSGEKRTKNVLKLDVSSYKNLQAAVSISNSAIQPFIYNTNILSALLLTNDLRGVIYKPGYYFKDKEPTTLQHLDLVMMTNGWRRFIWEEILENKLTGLKYPFERSLSISGKVLQSNGKSALRGAKINLIINGEDSSKILSEAVTNDISTFIVDNIDFKKEATIYYQGTNTNNKEAVVSVNFNAAYFDSLQKTNLYDQHNFFNEAIETGYLLNILQKKRTADSLNGKTLETVVVKTKKRSVTDSLNKQYATDFFYDSDQTLAYAGNYFDMFQYLRSTVPGILINKTDTGTLVSFSRYQGMSFSDIEDRGVQFYLNEIAVTNDVIESLSMTDVGLIKIFKGATSIQLGVSSGAIAVYTLKDKSTRDWRKKGFDYIKRSGYSVSREFYETDYKKVKFAEDFVDNRPTLYWNPSIKVENGNCTFDFYNDDFCKKFKVVVEGVDENGKILSIEKEF